MNNQKKHKSHEKFVQKCNSRKLSKHRKQFYKQKSKACTSPNNNDQRGKNYIRGCNNQDSWNPHMNTISNGVREKNKSPINRTHQNYSKCLNPNTKVKQVLEWSISGRKIKQTPTQIDVTWKNIFHNRWRNKLLAW